MTERRLYLNGINALTGQYLVPPMTAAEAAACARGTPPPAEQAGFLRGFLKRLKEKFFGMAPGVNPADPASSGWAVVFTPDTPEAVRKALQPLIDLRGRQIPADRCKVLEYKPGETREGWLGKYGAHGADVEPTCVPYYVLLVGGPDVIPFDFQFLLDINYAVGRLAFDRPEDYGRYVQAVVEYETAASVANGREVVYWGTRHDSDPATELSADTLITPLFAGLPAAGTMPAQPAPAGKFKFRARCFKGEDATKANLLEVLHARQQPPSLLFTASHGMGGWPKGDPRQRPGQGALLCQDWPGFGRIKPEHYLTAAEVDADARLQGLVAFIFACYGAGTPRFDPYLRDPGAGPLEVAAAPFVSALGQRLLVGGALTVIGHIERAWGYSLEAQGVGTQIAPFRNLVQRLLAGEPAGHSVVDFGERYATYSTELLQKMDPSLPEPRRPTDAELAFDWIERNDAQNYIVLGDPAVRLRTDLLK
jgi:hypothetical protein